MKPCPKTPNCVSSVETAGWHFVKPLYFSESTNDARYELLRILNSFKRVRVMEFEHDYVHAEFSSPVFGFVDDVVFHLDDRNKIIHVKLASRIGLYDLGINRRRIEKIREIFNERNNHGHVN